MHPVLFCFFQACRGDKYDHGQTILVKKSEPTISLHRGRGDHRDAKDSKRDEDSNPPKVDRQESLSSSVDPPQYHTPDATDAAGDDESDDNSDDDNVWKRQESGSSKRTSKTSDKTDALWSPASDIPVSPAPLYKDCLIMYATPPGE